MGGLVGLLVGGVGYAWVAEGVLDPDTRWIWVPPLVLALAAALTLPGQIFSRHPAGVSILARTAAYILLAGYVVLSVMGSRQWSFPLLLFASSCMAVASALLLWPTLKPSMTFTDTLLGVAGLLFGVAVLLAGVAVLRGGATLSGVAGLLMGVAFLLAGVAVLRAGRPLPISRWWQKLSDRRPHD